MGEHIAGEVINGYRIVGALGRGGIGTTFEAVKEATGEQVALKRLAVADVADWKRFELFEREARVLASLQHPAIPQYLDHFMVEGPRGPTLYLVQAIVRGQTLAEIVTGGGPLDEGAVRQITGELLMVLAYLGQRSPPVVHRDIKPENVMRRVEGPIALVDFGAARADHAKPAGGSTTVGTYGYMAPEQLHGVAVPATDIYGLACTMLFLLSGRSPAELPRQKLAIDFKPTIRTSPQLAAWLDKALAPAPEDRFASADAALAALRSGEIGGAAGPVQKKKRTLTWILAGVLGTTVLAATAIAGVTYVRDKRAARASTARAQQPVPALPARWPSLRHPGLIAMTNRVYSHVSAIFSVAVSPDGKLVASGANDGAVKIWDMATKEPVRALAGQSGEVRKVAWAADGSAVLSAGGKGILIQDLKTGATLRTLALPDGARPDGIAVSPDGKSVVVTSLDGVVRGFNLETGALLFDAKQPLRVFSVAMSPDGSQFATAQGDGIGLWNLGTGKLTNTRKGHAANVDYVAWAPDGHMFFSVSDDQTLKMWHTDRTDPLVTAWEATDEVWGVATEPRGKLVATVSKDGFLRVYNALTLKNTHSRDAEYAMDGSRAGLLSVAFAPDGSHIVTGDGRGNLGYFSLDVTSRPERVPSLPPDAPEDRVAKTPAHTVYAQTLSLMDKTEGDQKAYDRITATLAKAVADDPKNALNHVALAKVLRKRSRSVEGGTDDSKHPLGAGGAELDKAFALSPHLPEAILERGWAAHVHDDDARAKVDAAEAQRLGGPSAGGEHLLAELALAEGKFDDVDVHAAKAISLSSHSQSSSIYYSLRDAYWRQGDDAAYLRMGELQTAAAPWSAWAKGNFAAALLDLGEVDRAIEIGKQAVAQRNYGMARQVLANAYAEKGADALWNQGLLPEAKANFDSAVATVPTHALGHYGLGAYYRKTAVDNHDKKALAQSTKEFELALRSDPKLTIAKKAREDNVALASAPQEPPRGR